MVKNPFSVYKSPKMIVMMILGLYSALPFIMVFSTLSFWLSDIGLNVKTVAMFSLVRLPFSFKFLWAPLIDRGKIPFLTDKLGRRKSWGLLCQFLIMCSLIGLVATKPLQNPSMTAVLAICVAFFSASQDIVLDAFRIEYFDKSEQGAASATYVFGYRIGMLIAGAGALLMADHLGWTAVYQIIGLSFLIVMLIFFKVKEPEYTPTEKISFKNAVVEPLADFFKKPGWLLILLFLLTYKLCETTLGTVTPKLYLELGFTKTQIAAVVKVWGIVATLLGGFLGGALIVRVGIIKSLIICGMLQGISNLPFAVLSLNEQSFLWLNISIISDNMASGMATSAFVAYMSSLCNKSYTGTQYALLSSVMALPRDVLSASSGFLVQAMGWALFFVLTAFLSLPSLLILYFLNRKMKKYN
ncbi:MAG: MFS transporter [Alphaproteobacteria bacterium]|nr:MFS transporter [Alphaproteobacteria bacterium]